MRKKLINVSVLSVCFIAGICAQIFSLSLVPDFNEPKPLADRMLQQHELTGHYNPGDMFPWTFDNVRRIDLTTANFHVNSDSSITKTPIKPYGYLVTDYDVYKLADVSINAGDVSFTTQSSVGLSYQFSGRAREGNH